MYTLRVYEEKTLSLRSEVISENRLLISFRKPHKPVCSASIARWIKTVLKLAGIDTTLFKAHSVRAASTSAALRSGVSVRDIMSTADWSRESTFSRFYHKPSHKSIFGQTLLRKSKNVICHFKQYTVMYAGLPRHGIEGLARIRMIRFETRIPLVVRQVHDSVFPSQGYF